MNEFLSPLLRWLRHKIGQNPLVSTAAASGAVVVLVVFKNNPDLFGLRYRMKMMFYYGSLTLNACLVIPVSLLRGPGKVENMLMSAWLMKPVGRAIGLRYEVSGPGLPALKDPNRSCVVVLNHQHSIDVLALFYLWPIMQRCTAVAKRQLFWAGPFGLAAFLCGTTFINRGRVKEARSNLSEAVIKAADDAGMKVAVFPEGTRHHQRFEVSLLPFRTGAFAAALSANVSVVPIVIEHYHFLDTHRKIFGCSTVRLRVLEAVEPSSFSDASSMSSAVRSAMLGELNILYRESREEESPQETSLNATEQ